jgi:hypothetical protein
VPRARPPLLLAAAGLVALAVVVAGTVLRARDPTALGVATPPFVMAWGPRLHPLAAPAALVALLAPLAAPRLLALRGRPAGFAAGICALALALGLAVNAVRYGTDGWWRIFDLGPGGSFEAKNEYLPGLPALSYGVGFFLDRFAELVPSLPVNVAGHPPALMLVLHWTGIDTAQAMAALCIAAAALTPAAVLALGRAVGLEERRARLGAVLAAFSPVALLFGITSADAIFAFAGALTAALLCDRRPGIRLAGCAAFVVASLLSWALLAVGAFAAVVALRRDGPRSALVLAAACGAALVAGQGALALATGYDPLGTLAATEAYYRNSVASRRPYAFWVLGSPVAWGVMLGLPLAAGLLLAIRRAGPAGLAVATVVGVASVAGFTKAETERIWLIFVPLACVAAAEALPPGRVRPIAAALALQAFATAVLFSTIW